MSFDKPLLTLIQDLKEKGVNIWQSWKDLTLGLEHIHETVNIAMVGKYMEQPDSYLSVKRAMEHAAMRCRRKLIFRDVDAESLERATNESDPARFHKAWHDVCTAQGILVPGGFGTRGTEGMIAAANWARTHKVPYLGICLGMQTAVIEFARNVCKIPLPVALSYEFDSTEEDRVIISMPEHHPGQLGGTMRLGLRPTIWQPDTKWSKLRALYGLHNESITERHRHRYEVNPAYVEQLHEKGLTFIGKDDTGVRMEIIELQDHPWFVGVQFHPEYVSRVLHPSKPYLGFFAASAGMLQEVTEGSVNGIYTGMGSLKIKGLVNGERSAF